MQKQGFTLIELLVAMTVILLLVGLGLANYVRFNERQKLIQTQELIRQAVSQAQNYARSGKLEGCTTLEEYEMTFIGTEIELTPVCAVEADTEIITTTQLPTNINFVVANPTLTIVPITGLVYGPSDSTGPFTISFEKTNSTDEISSVIIDHSGSVKEYTE